jgi:hypothetical protein
MKKMSENVGAWLRGLVWTAMIAGCAWASAQSYLVTSPEGSHRLEAMNSSEGAGPGHSYVLTSPAGRYHVVAMGEGAGVGVGHGPGIEGAQNAEPAPKDDLFANTEVFAKNATHVTEITMDPDTLNMVGGSDERRAHNMVLNVVRSFTYDKPGMYNMADVDALRNKLNTGDWHCSIHTRDLKTGEGSDICGKRRTDGMKEEVIIEVSPTHLTFIHQIRRAGAPGTSELGYFPMLPGMEGLSSIAMLDPEAIAYMEMGLRGLPYMLTGPLSPMMLTMPGGQVLRLNSPEMKEKMDQVLKAHPIDPETMKKFQEQMKNFQKNFYKDKGSAAPVAPAPMTPQAPQ